MPSNPLRKILDRRAKEGGNSSEEALEKLERGIRESRQAVQRQNEELARGYLEDSIGALKRQLQESRATLEGLPEQIPGGEEESFKALIGKLTQGYARIEEALDEATKNAASVDDAEAPDGSEAEDADGRETEETGAEEAATEGAVPDDALAAVEDVGEIDEEAVVMEEVIGVAEQAVGGEVDAEEPPEASDDVEEEADELGAELPEVEGTGFGGAIALGGATEPVGGVEDAPDQASEIIGGVLDGAEERGEATQGDGQGADGGEEEAADEPKATNAARRRAEELGIDLKSIRGSGVNGLITIQDVVKL